MAKIWNESDQKNESYVCLKYDIANWQFDQWIVSPSLSIWACTKIPYISVFLLSAFSLGAISILLWVAFY